MRKILQLLGRPTGRTLLYVAGCWLFALLGPLSFLMFLAVICGYIVTLRRKAWLQLTLLFFLNPLTAVFMGAEIAYLRGVPTLRSDSPSTVESTNPDPVTRCFRSTGGIFLTGNKWLFINLHNSATRLMCSIFGVPSRAYDGPYPTRSEALALFENSLLTPVDEFRKGRFLADSEIVELQAPVLDGLLELVPLKDDKATPVRAKLYQKRCIVLRMSQLNVPGDKESGMRTDLLVLLDHNNQRPFAYYAIKGVTPPKRPPVDYLPEHDESRLTQ